MVTHDVVLGPGLGVQSTGGVALLDLRTPDFVPEFLAGLRSPDGRESLGARVVAPEDDGLRLHQPVHRVHHLAVVEASCATFGTPRLDPKSIDSAGFVLRRVDEDRPAEPEADEHWLVTPDERSRRWGTRSAAPTDARTADPELARRKPDVALGNPILQQLWATANPATSDENEATSPLFVAPPDACQDAGRTILWGVVSVTDARPAADGAVAEPTRDELIELLPALLRGSSYTIAGTSTLTPESSLPASAFAGVSDDAGEPFLAMVRFLHHGLDAFGGDPSRATLRSALDAIAVPPMVGRSVLDVVEPAARVLLDAGGGEFTLPNTWPSLSDDQVAAVADAVAEIVGEQSAALTTRAGRFADRDARYRLTCFVRVKRDDGCPPELHWGEPSEPFRIAPWYETADVPTVPIELPDPTDTDALRKLKPNVAFAVPGPLLDMLRKLDVGGLIDGEKPADGQSDLDWICGFSIPIITLCAFIVLVIFLTLLHLAFFWLPLVRICIPIPRRA